MSARLVAATASVEMTPPMSSRRRDREPSQPTPGDERALPHSLEAERAVLGAVIINNVGFDLASGVVMARSFYREAHRRIWDAIVALRQAGSVVDTLTVKTRLAQAGVLEAVGGPAYIASLTDGVPRSTNVEHYAQIVAEKATLRDVIYAANATLAEAYDGGTSATEIIQRADVALLALHRPGGGRLVSLRDSAQARFDRLQHRAAHRGELIGIDTGFPSINDLTHGWQPGDLDILAARTSVGKSTFLLNTMTAAARAGKRCALFSFEMRRAELEDRLVSNLSGIMLTRLQNGHLGSGDFQALSDALVAMHDLPIHIDDAAGKTVLEIRAACRRLQVEEGLHLVGVDYAQLVPGSLDRKGATRNDELADIARRLKAMAIECAVPVLLLSQLARGETKGGERKPHISQLRDSGTLEEAADIVALLHRKHHDRDGLTEFILGKQRNGSCGTVDLTIHRDTCTFTDGYQPSEAETAGQKGAD